MTTIHDEEKLEKLLSTHYDGESMRDCARRCAKQYAEHIRQNTIDECIARVPE